MRSIEMLPRRQAEMRQRWAGLRHGPGRPARSLDTTRIVQLARLGYPNRDIATALCCDRRVLKRYSGVVERVRAAARAHERLALFEAAVIKGDKKAIRQLLRGMEWPGAVASTRVMPTGLCDRQAIAGGRQLASRSSLAERQAAMKKRWLARPRRGRPDKKIGRILVKELALLGYKNAAIARAVDCDVWTLLAHCKRLLRASRAMLTFNMKCS